MAFNKEELYQQALKMAEENKCYFIEQLVSFLPCQKTTFYDFFPNGSDEMNAIKRIIDSNKVSVKTKMYKKWFDSDNPTLQVAFMKLIATDEEAHRLNGSRQEVKHEGSVNIIELGSGKKPK